MSSPGEPTPSPGGAVSSTAAPPVESLMEKRDWEQVQCQNVVPGYTGYIPAKYAQSSYGAPAGDVNKRAAALCAAKPCREESKNHVPQARSEQPSDYFRPIPAWHATYSAKMGTAKDARPGCPDHIIGYQGFVPGRKAENFVGPQTGPKVVKRAAELFDQRAKDKEADGRAVADRSRWAAMEKYYADLGARREVPGERSEFLKHPHALDPNYLGGGCNLKGRIGMKPGTHLHKRN